MFNHSAAPLTKTSSFHTRQKQVLFLVATTDISNKNKPKQPAEVCSKMTILYSKGPTRSTQPCIPPWLLNHILSLLE